MILEKIYYINLQNRTDRKEFIEKNLKKTGENYERFPATNLKSNDNLKNEIINKYESRFSPKVRMFIRNSNPVFLGLLGCYHSHLSLLNLIKNSKKNKNNLDSYFIILEDDAIIDKKRLRYIKSKINYLEEKKINWDIVRFGLHRNADSSSYELGKLQKIENELYKTQKKDFYGGAHLVCINYKNIDKIIKFFYSFYIDHADLIYSKIENSYIFINKELSFMNKDLEKKSDISYK